MSAKKILIVEDDLILLLLNKKFIQLLGHVVVKAVKSGEEAIEFALNEDNEIDLILIDVRLRGKIDGIIAMVEINKSRKIPAIYVTGNSNKEIKERAEMTNMLAFCIKPVSLNELELIIDKP